MWLVMTANKSAIELVYWRPDPAHQRTAVQCGAVPADRQPGRRDWQCRRYGDAEFFDGNSGTFSYSVNGVAQTKNDHGAKHSASPGTVLPLK